MKLRLSSTSLAVVFLATLAAGAEDDFDVLLARLRALNPGEAQKVELLAANDRDAALRFLRGRIDAAPDGTPMKLPPAKTPSKSDIPPAKTPVASLLPPRQERFEKFDVLRVGDFEMDLCRRDDGAFGLGEIRCGPILLRRADFLATWQIAGRFCQFANREGLMIRLAEPVATLVFVPVKQSVAGTEFAGFRIECAARVGPVVETVSWEIGGATHGLSFFDGYRGWHAPPAWLDAEAVPETNPKLVPSLLRGVGFQFEHGAAGSLATFHTHADGTTVNASRGSALEFVSTFNGEPKVNRTVLCAHGDSRMNLWTRSFELAHAELRAATGIPERSGELLVRWPPFSREGFAETARACAATTAADGFSGVLLDTIWENIEAHGGKKNLNTLDYTVSDAYGGEAGLRALIEACHERGLKTIAWTPSAHLVNSSPVWRAHPDWLQRNANGEPWLNPSGLSHGALDTEFAAYWGSRVAGVVQRSGLDGLWMDTHLPYAGQTRPADHGSRLAAAYASFIKAGARHLLVEGDASVIGGCAVLTDHQWLSQLREADDAGLLLGSSIVAAGADAARYSRHFRRSVACGAGWIVDWDFLHSPKLTGVEVDAARREIRDVLSGWRRVHDRMQHRFIHDDGSGCTWTNDRDRSRIVWLFKEAKLPDGRKGEPGKVYVLEPQ